MFELTSKQSPSPNNATIVPATSGFSLFAFAPGNAKASMQTLQEMVRDTSVPIVAWKITNGVCEPLIFWETPANAQRFVFTPSGRIYALDPHASWPNFDSFAVTLLDKWRRNQPPPVATPPKQFAAGEPVAVVRTGW